MNLEQVTYSVNDFIEIQDNPVQRDTFLHARKAVKTHLSEYSPTHERVAVAQIIGKGKVKTQLFKLDGHTRSFLWKREMLEMPNEVKADLYTVSNKDEVIKLYYQFDNAKAVESKTDRMSGAARLYGISPAYPAYFRNCGLRTALRNIHFSATRSTSNHRIPSEIESVKEFKTELTWYFNQPYHYNNKSLTTVGLPSFCVCAALILLRVDGNAALAFFDDVSTYSGLKSKLGSDGVHMAIEFISSIRNTPEMNADYYVRNVMVLLELYGLWKSKKRTKRKFHTFATKGKTRVEQTRLLHGKMQELGFSYGLIEQKELDL